MKVSYADRLLALVLLILLSPLFLLVYLLVLVTLGRPVFYTGQRLGLHKRPFNIIKFRTLPVNAQQRIGGELFSHHHEKIPVFAQFLRDTRLDELPQLINILRGEMRFFGPRPERHEVYIKQCIDIPGYEVRFQTPPGVIGVSQLCTPHSTPKAMRARIDRRYVDSPSGSLGFGAYAIWALFRRLVYGFSQYIWRSVLHNGLINRQSERRNQPRIKQNEARIEFLDQRGMDKINEGKILDMNHDHMRVQCDHPLNRNETYLCRLTSKGKRSLRRRTKTAYCFCHLIRQKNSDTGGQEEYIIGYEPVSPLNKYLIDQYFLHKSIIGCPD